MPRFLVSLVLVVLAHPLLAAPKRRAVTHPPALTSEAIAARVVRVADRVVIDFDPRLHWENAVYFDGLVLAGEAMNLRRAGSGDALIERAAAILLDSNDNIETVDWGDRTAFMQAAMDLYRVLPPSDSRRARLLALAAGPMKFAEHAIRITPADGPPRDPWWIAGGYGTRFWQDDLYMVVPWLASYGATGNELARNLAYEWLETYVYEHRATSTDVVPTVRTRRGPLLWDDTKALFIHDPGAAAIPDNFWGRGNGWAFVALTRAAEALDAPYSGGRYDQAITRDEIRQILRTAAESIVARRTIDGGWGTFLARPAECPVAETSATALLTFFLARGINDGWLERDVYTPIVMRAFTLLLSRVDALGNLSGIQPPGVGPDCAKVASDNGAVNVNYAPGALMLAAAEVMKFPDAALAMSAASPASPRRSGSPD